MYLSNFSRIVWVVGLLVWSEPVAQATIIDLTGSIRDFRDAHADMRTRWVFSGPGMVENGSVADGKPVYAGRQQTLLASGRENFDEWFQDEPGVNQSKPLTISLDNSITPDATVFTFSDPDFFPFDDELLSNEGRPQNYHFTNERGTEVTYQPEPSFTFSGDDHVFVFINDALIIDLGGVHSARTIRAKADTLGLTAGDHYDLDIFFAERQMVESNFRIDTSILLERISDHVATYPLL